MDNAFAYRADRMPRRRIDPLAARAAIASALLIALVGLFAKVVIDSEHRSVRRADALDRRASRVAERTTDYVDPEIDSPARTAALAALDAASAALAEDGSLVAADTTHLAKVGTGLIFVDGPSTTSQVVSLAGSAETWAAAVMGASGTCFYARLTEVGVETFGTGSECTGEAALQGAGQPSWDI